MKKAISLALAMMLVFSALSSVCLVNAEDGVWTRDNGTTGIGTSIHGANFFDEMYTDSGIVKQAASFAQASKIGTKYLTKWDEHKNIVAHDGTLGNGGGWNQTFLVKPTSTGTTSITYYFNFDSKPINSLIASLYGLISSTNTLNIYVSETSTGFTNPIGIFKDASGNIINQPTTHIANMAYFDSASSSFKDCETANSTDAAIAAQLKNIDLTKYVQGKTAFYLKIELIGVNVNQVGIQGLKLSSTELQSAYKKTVTFNSNGGSAVSPIETAVGGITINMPTAPTKAGVLFLGWYKDAALTQPFDGTGVVSNMTVYAKWGYSITFKAEGSADIVKYVGVGESLTSIPEVPAKQGNSGVWDRTSFTNITQNIVVNAIYSSKVIPVKENGLLMDESFNSANWQGSNSHVISTDKIKSGYTIGTGAIGIVPEFFDQTATMVYEFKTSAPIGKLQITYNARFISNNPSMPATLNILVSDDGVNYNQVVGIIGTATSLEFNYLSKARTDLITNYVAGKSHVFVKFEFKATNTAFYDWVSFDRLVISSYEEGDFEYKINNNTVTVTNYIGDKKDVVVPATIRDLPVTSISPDTFNGKKVVETVTMPDTIYVIGENAFANCPKLKSVTLSNGLTEIGKRAFYNCPSLESISLPDSVQILFDEVFYRDVNLKTVNIGTGLSLIGKNIFGFCDKLSSVIVASGNTSFKADNDGLYNVDKTTLVKYFNTSTATSYTIANTVTKIGNYAFFANKTLTDVIIPNTVAEIETGAFSECFSLANLTLSNKVSAINDNTFYRCFALKNIIFTGDITKIGNKAFAFCSSLENADSIISKATTIGDYAFENCEKLANAPLSQNLLSLGKYSFFKCKALVNLTIPNSLLNISEGAFMGCEKLSTSTLGNSVSTIGKRAFYDCIALTTVNIPSSVRTVDDAAFNTCTNLKNVAFSNGTTRIGYYAFFAANSLENITIPASVSVIGDSAFLYAKSLKEIKVDAANSSFSSQDGALFNKTKTTIYQYPVASSIENYVMPNTVYTIAVGAFSTAGNLRSIKLSSNLATIAEWSMSYLSSLSVIEIPATVTKINKYAFFADYKLKSAYFLGDASAEPTSYIFHRTSKDLTVNYLAGKAGFTSPLWNGYNSAVFNGQTPILYTLTVTNASGTAQYYEGDTVALTAPAMLDGQNFENWFSNDLSITDTTLNSITFTMPNKNVTVVANYSSVEQILKGDVDGNGDINVVDAMKTLQFITNKITLTEKEIKAANVSDAVNNTASEINVNDVLKILQFITSKIDNLD